MFEELKCFKAKLIERFEISTKVIGRSKEEVQEERVTRRVFWSGRFFTSSEKRTPSRRKGTVIPSSRAA